MSRAGPDPGDPELREDYASDSNTYSGWPSVSTGRDDLRLLYFASITPDTGELAALTLVPMQARNMRLRHANAADNQWLAATLGQISRESGSRVEHRP